MRSYVITRDELPDFLRTLVIKIGEEATAEVAFQLTKYEKIEAK